MRERSGGREGVREGWSEEDEWRERSGGREGEREGA